MSERLPYEENIKSRLSNLPVPDENQAWQKMQVLLDDDDDRVPPPVFLRSCMGWGLLLLTGLVVVWLVFHPEQRFFSKKTESKQIIEQKKNTPATTQPSSNSVSSQTRNLKPDSIQITDASRSHNVSTNRINDQKNPESKNENIKSSTPSDQSNGNLNNVIARSKHQEVFVKNKKANGTSISGQSNTSFQSRAQKKDKKVKESIDKPGLIDEPSVVIPLDKEGNNVQPVKKPEPKAGNQNNPASIKDSVKVNVKKADSPVVKKPFVDTTATAASPPMKKNYFSIGIGLQQQLPIAGQKSSPYNIYGRKGTLGDYLPSVYVRYHNQEKWLIHAEFRYGAPQNVKEVAYVQETFTRFDSTGGSVTSITTTNISTLKKTFYHQIPVSFDYFIRPGWSAGAGIMYSKFFSAISEDETHKKNNFTQAETVDKKIAQTDNSNDSNSFFTKSQVQITLSTEYTWKRLSGGIRYAKGLQPFIRYTTSSGELKEEKNQSVNVFIRFRLWKEDSKLKK